MPTDPFDAQLLADYEHFCRMFGHLSFAEFRILWYEADGLMQEALALGYEPSEVPGLLVTPAPPQLRLVRSQPEK